MTILASKRTRSSNSSIMMLLAVFWMTLVIVVVDAFVAFHREDVVGIMSPNRRQRWKNDNGIFIMSAVNGDAVSHHDEENSDNRNINNNNNNSMLSRRSLLTTTTTTAVVVALSTAYSSRQVAFAADTGAKVRGIEVTPFNGFIFNYRGYEYGGLSANEVGNESNISYQDFMNKLKLGEVEFVEFMAPNGDAAYVKFKNSKDFIRIGEGYPIEQHDGWSSPAFAIRAVQNAYVPYKFTVPALSKYRS